ncbi:MAG: NADH-quinone oxidoreductase subunit C [Armatimonadota bacterium]
MSELIEKAIRDSFPEAVREAVELDGVLNVRLESTALVGVCELLRSSPELGFDYLADITAIDWRNRIEVVYRMTNLRTNAKVVLRVDLDREKPEVDSVVKVWKGAEWQEREVYDLMGVVFRGHPDLRRILLPEDWEGYPLRKDYVIPD